MAISNEQAVSLDRAITASNEQMTGLYHNLRSRSEVKHAYASFKDNPCHSICQITMIGVC